MTPAQKLLTQKFIYYKFLSNLWFVGAIWLYFYRLFITDQQVGLLDGIAFTIGLVAEVPSGVMADRFGRDRMVKLGHILAGTGVLIQAFSSSLLSFVVGQSITMIGFSFVSGADEALFFDALKFKQNSVEWRKLLTKGSQVALIASLIAVLLGGWLYEVSPQLPWMLMGLSFIATSLLIWPITEKRRAHAKQNFSTELKEQLKSIYSGFLQFGSRKLILYVPLIFSVQGLFYAADWGLLRLVLLDRFTFSPFAGSVAIASCSLITVGVLSIMQKKSERLSEKYILSVISLLAVGSLLFSIPMIGLWGYVVILVLYASESVLLPFMSEIVNYRTTSHNRATILSVASFLRTLPYIVLAPLIGFLNTEEILEYFFVGWSILIAASFVFYLLLKKRDSVVRLQVGERL